MPRHSEFVEFVLDQMTSVGRPRARAMFGGYGIYRNDRIFAIVADDRLYFKADPVTRAEFEAKGLRPFTYVTRGKSVTMQYFEAPPEVFDEPDTMRAWSQKAYEAAVRVVKTTPSGRARRRTRKPLRSRL
jgi:DNA transformation protein